MKQKVMEKTLWTFNGEDLAEYFLNEEAYEDEPIFYNRQKARLYQRYLKNKGTNLGKPKKVRVTVLIED